MSDTETTTDVPELAEPAESAKPANRVVTALRRPRVLIAVVLVALLLGALGYAGVRLREQVATESARASAQEAAKRYATDLSTYDFQRLQDNFAAVTANAHGQFAQQYKQVAASLTELIKQNQAVSQGTVLSSGIVEATPERAVVLLFVDQKVTNVNNPQPRVDRNRMQITLLNIDDRWMIDGIQLL